MAELSPPPRPAVPHSNRSSSSHHRPDLESGDNIKVICRVRPFNEREKALQRDMNEGKSEWDVQPLRSVIEMEGANTVFLDHEHHFQEKERFKFDESLWSVPPDQQPSPNGFCSQEGVMVKIGEPSINHSWHGYNTCLFAYGQTGAGKTYTMMGHEADLGLIPRMCQRLFASIEEQVLRDNTHAEEGDVREYKLEARFLEIYNEHVSDLLWDLGDKEEQEKNKWDRTNLKVRNVPGQGPYVVGLTTLVVEDWETCMKLIHHGTSNRTTAATKMNEQSSRSHCIFKLTFTQITKVLPKKQFEKLQTFEKTSTINLVDLAGSERNKKSGAQGQQLKEAAAINKSLTTLKNVIDALVEGRSVIPYRESQLTWLLSENLGGNSKTFMIACVSPHTDNAEETLNTLRYALRTQGIVCFAQVNESEEARKLAALRDELDAMRQQIETGGGREMDEMRLAYEEGQLQLKRMVEEAKNHEREEEELRHAMEKSKEMKFAAAYHNAFRVIFQKRLLERAEQMRHVTARKMSLISKEAKVLVSVVQQQEEEVKEMARLENELTDRIQKAQRLSNFWQQKSAETVDLQSKLLNAEELNRKELLRKQEQRQLAATLGTLENEYLRTMMKRQYDKRCKEQETDLLNLKDRIVEKYQEYGTQHAKIIEDTEIHVKTLKENVASTKAILNQVNRDYGRDLHKLEEEQAFLEKEREITNKDQQSRVTQSIKEWSAKYDQRRQQEEEKVAQLKEDQQRAYETAMGKISAAVRTWQCECEAEMRELNRVNEFRLEQMKQAWETKYDRSLVTAADKVNNAEQYGFDMEAELKEIRQKEPRYKSLYEQIMKIVEAPSITGSGQYVRLVEELRLGIMDRYVSVIPNKYIVDVGNVDEIPRPVIPAPVVGVPSTQSVAYHANTDAFDKVQSHIRMSLQRLAMSSNVGSPTPTRGGTPNRLTSQTPKSPRSYVGNGMTTPQARTPRNSTTPVSPRPGTPRSTATTMGSNLSPRAGRKPPVPRGTSPPPARSTSPKIALGPGGQQVFRYGIPTGKMPTYASGALKTPPRTRRPQPNVS